MLGWESENRQRWLDRVGHPFSDEVTVTERIRRVDEARLEIEVTIDDPTTWTEPWTFVVNGKHDTAYWQVFEYACHEGNYGMTNLLLGSRAQERGASGSAAR